MNRIAAFAFVLLGSAPAYGQASKVEIVRKDLDYLAGDTCEGRGLQTKGILKAGEYIAEAFKASGLKPAFESGYFQPFDVPAPSQLGTPLSLVLLNGETKLEPKLNESARITTASGAGKKTLGVVFVGYGITSKEKPAYDDYAGVDVADKLVIVMRRNPQYEQEKGAFGAKSQYASLVSKVSNAVEHKAAGVLFVNDLGTAGENDALMSYENAAGLPSMSGPVAHVKRDIVDALLKNKNTTLSDIEKDIEKTLKPNSFELKDWQVESEVTIRKMKWPTRNVVAVSEGSGPLKDETVVIGAHYDHLGSGEPGSFDNNRGKVHYGADDNGSGTSGLLELARRYGAMTNRVGRRLVFIAFSGEEQGLFGSIHYAKNPAFPLDKTAFMLNMDMIGRVTPVDDTAAGKTEKKDRLVVYGTGTSTGLDEFVNKTNESFRFKLLKIPGGQGPSDHTSFYNKNVPVLFFFTGTHKDYHKPTDTPDKINVPGLLKVVDYVQKCSDHFCTVATKPDYLKTKGGSEDPTDPNSGNVSRVNVPRIGFMPGNYGEEDAGVLVEAVTKDGPAEKGGIKDGDFIIEVAGKPVKNMSGYMQALATVKAGTEIEIVVKRKDEKKTLKVTPAK